MEEQPRLIAHIVEQLGRFVTQKRAAASYSSSPICLRRFVFHLRATTADWATT
jgi:hypothetical protein